jgi:hypothetical protein
MQRCAGVEELLLLRGGCETGKYRAELLHAREVPGRFWRNPPGGCHSTGIELIQRLIGCRSWMAHMKWRVATMFSNYYRVVLHMECSSREYLRSMSMAYGVESQWICSKHH